MTIYDIAEKCGVSIATVSRVLNGSERVSEKTRQKIESVIKEEHYQPNPFARGLGLNSMQMIGALCEDISDSFYAKAISLIENHLRLLERDVILSCTGREEGAKEKYLQLLIEKHVDAIIIVGTPFHRAKDIAAIKQAAAKKPVILINSCIEHDNIYSIICDEATGIKNIVRRLAEHSCKNILYLYDSLTYSGKQKLKGYQEGIREYGLNSDLQKKIKHSLEYAEKAVKNIAKYKDFDAVVASEDLLAVGAQRAMLRLGRKIPIVGCNNSVLAQCATPTITSLDNEIELLCQEAVSVLTRLNKNTAVPAKIIFPARISERESFKYSS